MYVNEDYYLDTFEGTTIPEDDINKYLKLAQEKINSITKNRIVYIGFEKLTEFQKEKVSQAICYEAEHIFECGYNNQNNAEIESYSVLDININVKDKDTQTQAKTVNMSEVAYDLILQTGLANRNYRFNG